ncbi:cytochrome C [Chelatococcus daeguensis]|nr:cytochrome C [Chelatococcus daeguensis]
MPRAVLTLLATLGALIALSEVAAAQDAAAGERVFAQCKACHQVGPNARNAVGPVLNGLFGRKTGMVEGFQYSGANKGADITWTEETFAEYIRNPREKIPGTKMVFAGVKDEQKIKDLIAYLHKFDEAPVALTQ